MKKQFFLLSVLLAVANFAPVVADSCCDTSCASSCASSCNTSCKEVCTPSHGHTFMAITPEFAAASPERVSLFENTRLENLKHDDKHGNFQLVLFGGQNTKGSQTAAYYLPYGHQTLTFDGSIQNVGTFASDLAESSVVINEFGTAGPASGDEISLGGNYILNGYETIAVDPATYKFDLNKDTSKILPWNFGITYAALFEPLGASANGALVGTGLITNPQFKSTISPCLKRWHVGAGMELTYHFSDEPDGWYMRLSTAVQHVSSQIKLNEKVVNKKDALDQATAVSADIYGTASGTANPVNPNLAAFTNGNDTSFNANYNDFYINPINNAPTGIGQAGYATVAPVGSLRDAYLGWDGSTYNATGFPIDTDGADAVAPNNVTEAFNQSAWKYGKIGCANKITRLADIELSIGRLWTCGECATTMWELGLVIPTGNKPCATYVAPAVVGNGQHAGIRVGSTTTVMISQNDESSTWFTMVYDGRYLFRNTQKRSFDLKNSEWSRYMMVWANKDAYSSAVNAFAAPFATGVAKVGLPQRGYTPGINVFTTDFYIKPQLQQRLNQAVFYMGERFRAELGWNLHSRQKECVQLSCGWDAQPAFADSSDIAGLGLNNNRRIYNDSQTTVVNGIDSLTRGYTLANAPLMTVVTGAGNISGLPYYIGMPASTKTAALTSVVDNYDNFALTEADINFDSVATEAVISYTPYLALGYAFDYDCKPVLSVGASYEFTASNRSINQWMVWGKFEVAF
jgi:hypothetical protein